MDVYNEPQARGQDGDNRMPRTVIRSGSPLVSDRRRSRDKRDEEPRKRVKRDSSSPETSRRKDTDRDTTRRRSPVEEQEVREAKSRRDQRRQDDGRSSGRYDEEMNKSRSKEYKRSRSPQDRSSRRDREEKSFSKHDSRSPPPRRRSRSPYSSKISRRSHPRSSRSPRPRKRRSYSRSNSPRRQPRKALPSQEESYTGNAGPGDPADKPIEKEKPNFKLTGLLAAETNKVTIGSGTKAQNIVLKYHEPGEARKPPASEKWVLYVFKGEGGDPIDTIQLYSRSCWLLGRETAVADIPVEHPSCSKQHAVFQFRHVVKKDEYGDKKSKVGLYLLDLESANGTMLNGNKIDAARYVECLTGDVVKFGDSEREYVLLLPPKAEKADKAIEA